MNRKTVAVGLLFVLVSFLALPLSSMAQVEFKEGMTQGDFALWLVEAIGAQTKLPPAATGEDAIAFLTQLGSIPEGGWQKDEAMSAEALASLLEKPEEGANLSFEELAGKVRDYVQKIFNERKQGVFRVLSPTPSLPPV